MDITADDLAALPIPEMVERAWRNKENLVHWDWDDTVILQAYERVHGDMAGDLSVRGDSTNPANLPIVCEIKQWPVGSYCRARYSEDECFYEAKVVSCSEDHALVEFLGYKNKEEVNLCNIKESYGKQTRRNQVKEALEEMEWPVGSYCRALYSADGRFYEAKVCSNADDCSMVEFLGYKNKEEVDFCNIKSSRGKEARKNQIKMAKEEMKKYADQAYDAEGQENNYVPPINFHYPFVGNDMAMHAQSVPPFHGYEFPLNAYERPMAPMPYPPVPPAPPCSTLNNDPSMSAMLISWFMSGYYTGLNENQRGTHANSVNACCHGCHGHSHH